MPFCIRLFLKSIAVCSLILVVPVVTSGQTQHRIFGTTSSLIPPDNLTPRLPTLNVVGQTVNARLRSGILSPLIGIDYIRLYGLYGTEVEIYLPNQEIPVSASVRIPLIITAKTNLAGVRSVQGSVQFSYHCELIDLIGVGESNAGSGQCTSTVPFSVRVGVLDTIWIDGISKLCGITSTDLTSIRAVGIAEKGQTRVLVHDGELRQTGHCVTDGTKRLVFNSVALGVYPQPTRGPFQVTLQSLASHSGTLYCYDVEGNERLRVDITEKPAGVTTQSMDLTGLPPGNYSLQYRHASGISAASVMVFR